MSASELARRLRAKEITSSELVEAHIDRIQQVNPVLNAMVADRFHQAREEAAVADRRLKYARNDANLPPLLGVPCTIKEFIAVTGQPHTGGLKVREGATAEEDASLVARLKAAGVIILGSTNAPEGGVWHETTNTVYGRTRNPWDLHRTPGGSSGGEGALIAAGASPFGIGSDVGGSIRIPAGFCGIVGHKPTHRMVPNHGHFPPAPPEDHAYLACGPMTRSVEDLMPILRVIHGVDERDSQMRPIPLGDPASVDLSKVTVYPLEGTGASWTRQDVKDGIHAAASALESSGARIADLNVPNLRHAFDIWAALMSECGVSYDVLVGDGEPISYLRQLALYPRGKSDHTGAVLLMIGLQRLLSKLPDQTERMSRIARELQVELEEILGTNAVLLHPVFSTTAPLHRTIALNNPRDVGCTAIFNILEFPVTVVPAGTDRKGLPRSVQVVGARGQDHLTIAVAQALEDKLGRWQPVDPRWGKAGPLGLKLA